VSVTAAAGFVAAGGACGVKEGDVADLAIVATDDGSAVPAAAVFTTNLTAAAPVQVSRQNLQASGGRVAAVVLNSGNANASTGAPGREAALAMARATAIAVGCRSDEVLVCSTGLIGIPLPVDRIVAAIPTVAAQRSRAGGAAAAEAILTTDTGPKEALVVEAGFAVGGMAKGAAMLAPNMATMLAVLTTDATATPRELSSALTVGVAASFNRLTVDGCTSTNDTVILLASGKEAVSTNLDALTDAVTRVCCTLASQMAGDAEGATKVVDIAVEGAASDQEAAIAARQVAQSQLVKCSLYGEDPYWGRISSELGSAGVNFDQDQLAIAYGGTVVCRGGVAVAHDEAAVKAHLAQAAVEIVADLGIGSGRASVLTNDLTPAYIAENMRTS
jgi:glutamate N-acetyltransferase/amino-acid N-acetyltransferase